MHCQFIWGLYQNRENVLKLKELPFYPVSSNQSHCTKIVLEPNLHGCKYLLFDCSQAFHGDEICPMQDSGLEIFDISYC